MATLAEINTQDASTLVCDYMICKRCGIVDRERARMVVDSPCPVCHQPAGVAQLYFPINVHILVDLVQQAYHSYAPVGPIAGPQAHTIGPVLFFCTLREGLLNHLLLALLRAENTRPALIEKLLSDNKLPSQKFSGLFEAAMGRSWMDAVKDASTADAESYASVSELMQKAAQARNLFVHEGVGWTVTREFATECVNGMPMLFKLFVALHNLYVRPHLGAPCVGSGA